MTVTAAALLAGGAFGVRHALEADHVAAVATLVERGEGSAATGVAWGVGHSVPLLAVGGLLVALDVRLPGTVATAAEAVAGLALVALGVRALAGREALGLAVLRHVHGRWSTGTDGGSAADVRVERGEAGDGHRHLRIADRALGLTHSHADEESFAVGLVHGFAGSGGVAVVLAGAAPTVGGGAAFLAGFVGATVAAMGLAAWGWGRAVGRTGRFRSVAGVASVAVGLLLLAETAGVPVPL